MSAIAVVAICPFSHQALLAGTELAGLRHEKIQASFRTRDRRPAAIETDDKDGIAGRDNRTAGLTASKSSRCAECDVKAASAAHQPQMTFTLRSLMRQATACIQLDGDIAGKSKPALLASNRLVIGEGVLKRWKKAKLGSGKCQPRHLTQRSRPPAEPICGLGRANVAALQPPPFHLLPQPQRVANRGFILRPSRLPSQKGVPIDFRGVTRGQSEKPGPGLLLSSP